MNIFLTKSKITKFFLILFLGCSVSFIARADAKEATNFINDLADRVISIAKRSDLDASIKEAKLNEIFFKAVDTRWIGKFSLGQYWRTITPEQQEEFLNLYSKYLAGMYVPNFRKYTGNVVKVINSKEVRPNEYFVQTVIINSGGNEAGNIQVNYMMRQNPKGLESFVIFDVIAEGVSLITTQRAELGSVMANNGFDATIDLLKRKTSSSQ